MEVKQTQKDLESDPSRYRIYLVGFPEAIGTQNSLSVTELIQNLIPEARVRMHRIFNRIVPDDSVSDADLEDRAAIDKTEIENFPANEAEYQSQSEQSKIAANSTLEKNKHTGRSLDSNANNNPDGAGIVAEDGIQSPIYAYGNGGKDVTENGGLINGVSNNNFFSPGWIRNEALDLLNRIQRHGDANTKDRRVVLAGHGFGGIVAKQAIIIANTTPKYYDAALSITSLVFFATPHRSTGRMAWEEVLLEMLKENSRYRYHGRLSQILSDLVDSVSQLSHVFYRFVSKYPITNFIYGRHADVKKFGSNFEEVVLWEYKEDGDGNNDILPFVIDDLDNRVLLRKHFAPLYILSSPYHVPDRNAGLAANSSKVFDNLYLNTIQVLAPSQWTFSEMQTLDKPEELSDLQEIYSSSIGQFSFESFKGGSIQITGPTEHGRSTVMKLLLQNIIRESSVIVMDSFADQSPVLFNNQYGVMVSFIHQIISQRPSLLHPVRALMAEALRHNTWSEAVVKSLLHSILRQSQSIDYLILINDFESWPLQVRSWWSNIPQLFPRSSQSTCTFILSSDEFSPDFTPGKSRQLSLSKGDDYKQTLITNTTQHLLQPSYGVSPFHKGFGDDMELDGHIKNAIISKILSFKGSMASTRLYIIRLFQSLTLNSPTAIKASLSKLPLTQEKLFEELIDSLRSKPDPLPRWAKAALSWTFLAVRPLRIEELAVATAVCMDHGKASDIENAISINMERDLHNNLAGLLSVENKYVRLVNPKVKNILDETVILKGEPPGLYEHQDISLYCLQYLRIVLGGENSSIWDGDLTFTMSNHYDEGLDNAVFTFLHYACRFWPVHFLQNNNLGDHHKQEVVDFLLSNVAERWFRLYILSNSLQGGHESSTEVNRRFMKEATGIEAEESLDPKKLAIVMANYVVFSSVVCYIQGVKETDYELKTYEIRHGCLERSIIFSDVTSSHYLDCIVSNDDDTAVKELFTTNPSMVTNQFALHKAAWAGCLKVVQALLKLVDNPAQANDEGRTPLHMAVLCGHLDIVSNLVGSKTPKSKSSNVSGFGMIDCQDNDSKTALIIAAELGHVEIAAHLLESNANIALKDENGRTAVHHAVLHSIQILEKLIAHDKDVINIKDADDRTPLHFAAIYGQLNATVKIVDAARKIGATAAFTARDKELMTPLHHAAQNGHTETVNILIAEEKSSTDYADERDNLPADVAAKHGHLAVVKAITRGNLSRGSDLLVAASSSGQLLVVEYLLQKKVSPNEKEDKHTFQRPLTAAAANGWSNVVQALLHYHPDINLADWERLTPLHHAAKNGRKDVAIMLLSHKNEHGEEANANAPDQSRYTPLHLAALQGHIDIMELLLDKKANIHARSRRQETPLHLAIRNTSSVNLLLGKGAEIDDKDIAGQTSLHTAIRKGYLESVRLLLERGASIDIFGNDGHDALSYAIVQNKPSIVEEIFKRSGVRRNSGWDSLELAVKSAALDVLEFFVRVMPDAMHIKDEDGRTLLCLAAGLESLEVLTFLLEKGSDINHQGRLKRTPLLEAVTAGEAKSIQKLIAAHADTSLCDEYGDTALIAAVSRQNLGIVKILVTGEARIDDPNKYHKTPLFLAAYHGKTKIVQYLLEAGADTQICDNELWSPLHAAADNFEISKALIDAGADINYQKEDKWSPLHLSASWGYPRVVRLLLESGADPNLVNDMGRTALHVAIRNEHIDVCDVLLSYKGTVSVDLNKQDREKVTAIHTAITDCDHTVVKKLMDRGAKVDIELGDGTTYLDVAIDHNQPKTLAVLLGVDESSESRTSWTFRHLVTAYWRATDKARSESVETLQDLLIEDISREGSNDLEQYMNLRMSEESYFLDGLLTRLVETRLNPFKRQQACALTYFELGFVSRYEVDIDFLNACLKFFSENLEISASALGFRELRIATEIESPDIWTKFASVMERVESESDQDNWNIHHFLYQAMPRKEYAKYDETALQTTKTPTALVWPSLLHRTKNDIETTVEISTEGVEASFLARPGRNDGAVTIRANFPFPPRLLGLSYFELSILQTADDTKSNATEDRYFVIGLSGEFVNHMGAVPGWRCWSLGYHGDDGMIYEKARWNGAPSYGEIDGLIKRYSACQTVGCGIDYQKGEYFFTCDGEIVFRKSSQLIFRKLYPSIGHCGGPGKVRVNFGETEFEWQEADLAREAGHGFEQPEIRVE